jgi:hypothetical protein
MGEVIIVVVDAAAGAADADVVVVAAASDIVYVIDLFTAGRGYLQLHRAICSMHPQQL